MPEKKQRSEQARLGLGSAPGEAKGIYEPFVPGPNPALSAFVKQHATLYDPKTDKYDVKSFNRDIVVDKAAPPKAIYDMHTYWSKKHWVAIREYIRHYLPKNFYPDGTGVVLDCFSGSGMTGVAAMMENRPCVLVDASPAAAFISHCYTHPADPDELGAAYDRMMTEDYPEDLKKKLKGITGAEIKNLEQELEWLYATKCDRCGGEATTEYIVYSEQFQCPGCSEVVALFDCPEAKVSYLVGSKAKQKTVLKKRRVCPHCLKKYREPHRKFVISTRTKPFGRIPVLVIYECVDGCKPKRDQRGHCEPKKSRKARFFEECDLKQISIIEKCEISHWFPRRNMMDVENDSKPWGDNWRPGRNFRTVAQLYTKRNLWALAAIKAAITRITKDKPCAQVWQVGLTAVALNASLMYRYRPSLKGGLTMGTYYIPQESQIMRASSQFADKRSDVLCSERALFQNLKAAALLSNENAKSVSLAESSVDFIFTDPPYVEKIQYGELNFFWESWLGFSGNWLRDEIIVNAFRSKSLDSWEADIRHALGMCFRVLKPGRWLALCYHDSNPTTWTRVQNVLLDIGFEIHTVTVLDPKQKSSNQLMSEKVVKSDLVLNCRKPCPGEQQAEGNNGEAGQVSQRVREILIETLSTTGGQTRDKLWDIVLKRLLSRGQMAEHRFGDLLNEVATRSESGRWFLKEEFECLSENDLRNEENAGYALDRFARFRCMGVPVSLSAQLALSSAVEVDVHEDEVERYIKRSILSGEGGADFKLGGRMKGCEFYDCLFFYLTRYLKGRPPGRTPRRNLAEFLEEYLVRFRDGEKWLYRQPTESESASLKKSRESGLGRRVRQYVAFLNGEGDFPKERMPDAKTLVAWLKHCANFGLAEAGVALFEKGGLIGQVSQLGEEERYDAEDYYAQCRRNAGQKRNEAEEEGEQENGEE